MKTLRRVIFPIVAVAALTAVVALAPRRAEAQETSVPSPLLGQPAPAWTLKDLDGNDVSFSQFKGKVVVVDFWATWCGPCIKEIPGYVELQKKYGKDGLVIIGISVDTKKASAVKAFAEKQGMNYTVVMAGETTAEDFGGIEAIPTTFLIDRNGKVVHAKLGAWEHDDYEKLVKKTL